MNKLFTKIATFVAGTALAVGVGVAVGSKDAREARADEVVYTLTPASGSNNSYAGNCDIDINGITWNLTGNSTMQPWRIGGKNLSENDRALYSKTAISDNISKIDVTHGTAADVTVHSWTVIVSKNADFSNPVSTLTPTFAASTTTSVARPDGVSWEGCYFKFVYNLTIGGSNKFLQFTEAKFYASTGKTSTTTSVEAGKTLLDVSLVPADSTTVTASVKVGDDPLGGAAVSFNASPEGVVSLSGEGLTRTVTAVAEGTATITASYAGDDTHNGSSDSVEIEVTSPEVYPEGDAYPITLSTAGGTGAYDAVINGKSGLKIGTGSAGGSASLSIGKNAYAVTFRAAAWTGINNLSLDVSGVSNPSPASVELTPDTGATGNSPFTLAGKEKTYLCTVYFDIVASNTNLVLTTSIAKRFVIWDATYYIGEAPAEQLDAPVISISGSTVSWENVANNSGYRYSLKQSDVEKAAGDLAKDVTSVDLSTLDLENGTYDVTVVTKGDGKDYAASDDSNVVQLVVNVPEVFPDGTPHTITLSTEGGTHASEVTVNTKAGIKAGKTEEAGAIKLKVGAGASALTARISGWFGKATTISATGLEVTPSEVALTSDNGISGGASDYTLVSPERHYLQTFTFDTVVEETELTFTATVENRFVIWDATYYVAEPTKLDAPVISISEDTVSWSNVANNSGYHYSVKEASVEKKSGDLAKDATSLDLSTLNLDDGEYTVTVVAKGDGVIYLDSDESNTVNYVVETVVLESLEVSGTYKDSYFVGESFSPNSDFVVKAVYSNGDKVPVTTYTISPTTFEEANPNTEVTISYTEDEINVSTKLTVSVVEDSITSYTVNSDNVKKSYYVGEEFDFTGLVVTANYASGKHETVTTGISFEGFDSSTPDVSQTITVKVGTDVAGSYTVEIKEDVVSYVVDSSNVKKVYFIGDTLDTTGLVVTKNYESGKTSEDVSAQAVVEGFNSSVANPALVLTVKVNEVTAGTYTISVSEVPTEPIKTELRIKTAATKLTYKLNDTFSSEGLVVEALMSQGDPVTLTSSEYSVTPEENWNTTAGEKTVTIHYLGTDASLADITYKVTVVAKEVASITTGGKYPVEFTVGDTFSYEGLIVTAHYTSELYEDEEVTGFEVTAPDMTTAGEDKVVTVSYGEKTTTYTVDVVAAPATLESIEVTTNPTKTTYNVGEDFSPNGIVITAHYSDSSTKVINDSSEEFVSVTFSGTDFSTAGTKNITVTYGGKTTTFTVTVVEPTPTEKTLTSIAVTTAPSTTEFTVGDNFSANGIAITVTYSDSSTKVITDSSEEFSAVTFSGYDLSKAGEQTVTVTYSEGGVEKTATYTITVKAKQAPAKKGCFGDIASASIILSTLALAGTSLLVFKKRKEDK